KCPPSGSSSRPILPTSRRSRSAASATSQRMSSTRSPHSPWPAGKSQPSWKRRSTGTPLHASAYETGRLVRISRVGCVCEPSYRCVLGRARSHELRTLPASLRCSVLATPTGDLLASRPVKKAYGQHFLRDPNILGVIGRLAELQSEDVVLEIGPG